MTDVIDTVLQQAQAVAFAIPEVGPVIAAGASILDAIYDAMTGNSGPHPVTYTLDKAVTDLQNNLEAFIQQQQSDDNLVTVGTWQDKRAVIERAIGNRTSAADVQQATAGVHFVNTDKEFDHLFVALGDSLADDMSKPHTAPPGVAWTSDPCCADVPAPLNAATAATVRQLETYALARTTHHSLCVSALRFGATQLGISDDRWHEVDNAARQSLDDGLQEAVFHLCRIIPALEAAFVNNPAAAKTAAGSLTAGQEAAWNVAFTHAVRTQNSNTFLDQLSKDGFVDATTASALATYRSLLTTYRASLDGLRAPALVPKYPYDETAPATAPSPAPAPNPSAAPLGPRAPKTARFLYQTGAKGDYFDVTADPTVAGGGGSGLVATQNAGSAKSGIYYQLGGTGVNGVFTDRFTKAGLLATVQSDLGVAYDKHYGTGTFAADAKDDPTTKAPRQDRLTSLLIPYNPAPPIDGNVIAMVYSAAPLLGPGGITDKAAYKQIYTDALDAIATWNADPFGTPFEFLRITMLSTGTNAGSAAGATLFETSAAMIVEAVNDALKAHTNLASLIVLVNSNSATGDNERKAFDKAAAAKGVTSTLTGFDLPIT